MPEPLSPAAAGPIFELPFTLTLRRSGGAALHAQLASRLRAALLAGQLPPGSALPATRALARSLGVTRGVVVEAYAELAAEGYLETRQGSATRVAQGLKPSRPTPPRAPRWLVRRPAVVADPPLSPALLDFRLGQPTTLTLDRRGWARALSQVARTPLPNDYGDPAGEPELRAALAAFMGRARGLRVAPQDVLVTAGAVQALDLIARALLNPGDAVVLENPGYRAAHARFGDAGAQLVTPAFDADGLVVDGLPPARLVYVTPSHQFPLGLRMSVARRLTLLDWAEREDALIIEDDYDGEYRYGAPPLPPLASLDRSGRVIYLGTLSKVLSPALRLGYAVAQPAVRAALVREKMLADAGNPWLLQAAVCWLLQEGHLDRHIRRTRRHYAALQSALAQELAPLGELAQLGGIEAGLHACLQLTPPLAAEVVAERCLASGVRVATLADYRLEGSGAGGEALLLGYGGLTLPQLRRGAQVICRVIQELAGAVA